MTDRPTPGKAPVVVLMGFVLLWSGALATGFAYAAFAGAAESSAGRTLAYGLLAGFTGLLAARTGYELVRKLREPRDRS